MNRSTSLRRAPVALVGALLTAVVTLSAAGALAADGRADPQPADYPARVNLEWTTRRELLATVVRMPTGWPATEVMRHAAARPLGNAHERARWRATANHMPSGWAATDAMQQAAAWPAGP